MQTIDRPTSTPRRTPPWAGVAGAIAAVLAVPLLLLAVFTRWGVLIAVLVALVVGLGIWVWQRGFVFIEIAAFLIHFDGLGAGPVRMGRVIAATAAIVLVVKLLKGWRPPAIPVRHWAPVAALTVWALISGLWSLQAGNWFLVFGVYGLGIMFFCIGGLLIDSHHLVEQFLRAYWVGGLFGSAAGVIALFLGTRSVGFGADPNFFGLLQASMIPLTVYYRRNAVTAAQRWWYTLALALVLAGAAGAGSRSGLIGAGLAIVGTMVTRPGLRTGRRVAVGIGSILLATVAMAIGFVANPNNLQRGLSDRGAGRLDLWTVSVSLIKQRPIEGYGFGQLPTIIPSHLLTTPGSQLLSEFRPDVAAHNTWLDVTGDLGGIGLVLFVLVFVVAIVGLIRPRWPQARQLTTMLFVMMLPVLSGSFFLPLLNNKLSWVLIGLSASLQVPSARARWKGFAAAVASPPSQSTDLVPSSAGRPEVARGAARAARAVQPMPGGMDPDWETIELARWDLRISRPLRLLVLSVGMLCAVVAVSVAGSRPVNYTATATLWVPAVDGSVGLDIVRFDRERFQSVLTLGISGAYAQELISAAGLDMSVDEVRSKLDATRPRMGSTVQISFSDTDRAVVESVMPHLFDSLDALYSDVTAESIAQTEDELRPRIPGESPVYTGPAYLRPWSEAELSSTSPRTSWYAFVAFLAGAAATAAIVLAGQRHPRLTATDDLRGHIGVPAWAHVGGSSRRAPRSADQFAQILATAASQRPDDPPPRRIVVASPRGGPSARSVAVGLAVEVVALGGRALLVDADGRRPLLSARLGGVAGAGMHDVGESVELSRVIRRVNARRLPRFARRMLRRGPGVEGLRFVPAGRFRRARGQGLRLGALDEIDPEVTVVVLAPPMSGDSPTSTLLGWADAVVLVATVGRTTTHDLEDAAVRVHGTSSAPAGAVLVGG